MKIQTIQLNAVNFNEFKHLLLKEAIERFFNLKGTYHISEFDINSYTILEELKENCDVAYIIFD